MKKIFMIIILLFLTGCTIRYDIDFNEDNTITETIHFVLLEGEFVENKPDNWNEIVEKYNLEINENYTNIKLKRTVNNINKIMNDELFKKYVGEVDFVTENHIEIVFNDVFKYNMFGSTTYLPYIDILRIYADPDNIAFLQGVEDEEKSVIQINSRNKIDNIVMLMKKENIEQLKNDQVSNWPIILLIIFLIIIIGVGSLIWYKHKKINEF